MSTVRIMDCWPLGSQRRAESCPVLCLLRLFHSDWIPRRQVKALQSQRSGSKLAQPLQTFFWLLNLNNSSSPSAAASQSASQPVNQPASQSQGRAAPGLTKAASPHPGRELSALTQASERSSLQTLSGCSHLSATAGQLLLLLHGTVTCARRVRGPLRNSMFSLHDAST